MSYVALQQLSQHHPYNTVNPSNSHSNTYKGAWTNLTTTTKNTSTEAMSSEMSSLNLHQHYMQHNHNGLATKRNSFKGSEEELAMITNFKRFKRKGSSSRYKGVFFVKKEKKYRAQICLKGKKKYVGTFKTDVEAAIARDKRVREMFGEVEELLNFPDTEHPQGISSMPDLLNGNEINNDKVDGDESDVRVDNVATKRMKPTFSNMTGDLGVGEYVPGNMQSRLHMVPLGRGINALSRYGSSGSVSLPYFNFGPGIPIPNESYETQSNDLNYSNGVSQMSQNDKTLAPWGQISANGLRPNTLQHISNSQEPNGMDQQQIFGTNLPSYSYSNYNNFFNLNIPDLTNSRSKAMLAKRFSSTDTNFSLGYQHEAGSNPLGSFQVMPEFYQQQGFDWVSFQRPTHPLNPGPSNLKFSQNHSVESAVNRESLGQLRPSSHMILNKYKQTEDECSSESELPANDINSNVFQRDSIPGSRRQEM